MLTPQIENIVRQRLQEKGVRTAHTDSSGVTTENGLSSLVENAEFEEAFGENLAFEIKALFCSPYGANLRNHVAHGLLNDRECYSADAVYAWWLALKLVHHTLWSARNKTEEDVQEQPDTATSIGKENQTY